MEWGAICHALERCMEWREKKLGNYNKRGPQQPDSGRFFCGWLKRFVLRRFFLGVPSIFFSFFFIYFLQRQLPRALSNGWIHTSRAAMDNGSRERAGTASRNHLLPDSFHLFIFMSLFLFFFLFFKCTACRRRHISKLPASPLLNINPLGGVNWPWHSRHHSF